MAKVLGGLLLFGFAVEKFKGIKSVEDKLESWSKAYKSHFKKDTIISRKDYNKLTEKLRKNGFDKIANEYDKIIADQKGDNIKIGSSTLKTKDSDIKKDTVEWYTLEDGKITEHLNIVQKK